MKFIKYSTLFASFTILISCLSLNGQDINNQMVNKLISECKLKPKTIWIDTVNNELTIKLNIYEFIKIYQLNDTFPKDDSSNVYIYTLIERKTKNFTVLSSSRCPDENNNGSALWTFVVRDNLKNYFYDKYKLVNMNGNNYLLQVHYLYFQKRKYGKPRMNKFNCVYKSFIRIISQ